MVFQILGELGKPKNIEKIKKIAPGSTETQSRTKCDISCGEFLMGRHNIDNNYKVTDGTRWISELYVNLKKRERKKESDNTKNRNRILVNLLIQ